MKKRNRFESAYSVKNTRDFMGAGLAWWGLAMFATGCFAIAVTWLLTTPIA